MSDDRFQFLKALVLDWAGTAVDHGSCAPAFVFQEIFRRRGVSVTPAQAREPMGRAKRDHIEAIATMPDVSNAWQQEHGAPWTQDDIDAMYADFLPLQKETLRGQSDVIEGVAESVQWCRDAGLKIGSSTGYTHELMSVVQPIAAAQGYEPDVVLCSEDAPQGRPAPYLLHEAAKRLGVYPMWHVVKVDDTPVGIEAGRNAGCWTVGVTRTGNGVGLSSQQAAAMPSGELQERCEVAAEILTRAGAHFIVESVADLRPVLEVIESRLSQGQLPVG